MRWLTMMVLLVAIPQSFAQGLITVTFDGDPAQPPGTAYAATNYVESYVHFTGNFTRTGAHSTNDESGLPTNSTTFVQAPFGTINVVRDDGINFGLTKVDLTCYSSAFISETATFTGQRSDGTVLSTNFVTTGTTFQTFYFSADFTNFTNVTVVAGSMDNLVVNVPPLPPKLSVRLYHYSINTNVQTYVAGIVGLNYRLEYSTNLSDTNWLIVTNFNGGYIKVDSLPPAFPQRFYRAVLLP